MDRSNAKEVTYVLKQLEANDHIESLSNALALAVSDLTKGPKTQGCLNRILCELVDLTFKNKGKFVAADELHARIEPPKREVRSPKPNISRSPSASPKISQFLRNTKSTSSYHKLTMSYSKLKQKRKEDSFTETFDQKPTLLSGFNHLQGPVAFSKAKRTFDFYKPLSPGPAAYQPKSTVIKSRSPSHSIPLGAKGFNLARDSSPGPQAYYPSEHYITH